MYPRRKRVRGKEAVQFWVRLAAKNRGFANIAVYLRVEGLGDRLSYFFLPWLADVDGRWQLTNTFHDAFFAD